MLRYVDVSGYYRAHILVRLHASQMSAGQKLDFELDHTLPSDENVLRGTCMGSEQCNPGLYCGDASIFEACSGSGCCTPICETDLPDVDDSQNGGKCPDSKMVCLDWFLDNAPEGFDRLGICAIP